MNNEYIKRINKTLDYIERNIQHPFTLDELAEVACFSKYHFNRIFHALVKETPFRFINRLRLEKAVFLLQSIPTKNISEIATNTGFNDLAVFSRNFKKQFGMSPTAFRESKNQLRNFSQTNRKISQNSPSVEMYFCTSTNTMKWRTNMELNKSVEIKNFPDMEVAYIRYTGPYAGNEQLFERLWNELFQWAGPKGLIGGKDFKSLIIYHDDPNITDESQLRMSVCITVPPETKTDGKVGRMKIDGGEYVVARFELTANDFAKAWQWVYAEWFPASGYQPDDKPAFEMYPEAPENGKFIVDICVPVKPL
jgi:AraC family transcriptional regulator